jgi:hypothetical protein
MKQKHISHYTINIKMNSFLEVPEKRKLKRVNLKEL